jgi:hypothetical protein
LRQKKKEEQLPKCEGKEQEIEKKKKQREKEVFSPKGMVEVR